MYKRLSRTLYVLLLITWVGVFASSIYYIKAAPAAPATPAEVLTPTVVPTIPPTPATAEAQKPGQTVPDTGDEGWSLIQPGLERRQITIYNDQNQPVESVHVWRLDQNYFRLDVAFDKTPKTLESWQKETNASIVLNGGFYSIENEIYSADGLTILNGKAFGRAFHGYGGMLAINGSRAELRWLIEQPYNAYEPLHAALQSFPILVKPGGQLGFGTEMENHVQARRTVIGQDRDGRILFIVTPQGHFTLHQLSVYLTESDLDLDIAVNLDGGGSTGIFVANPRESIPATRPLPFVILAYAR